MNFSSAVFQKVSALAREKNLRFVAINRRGYSGSTPFSDADATLFTSGSDSEKAGWLKHRGCEIFNFVDAFILREKLSPVSADGKNGGIALLGWSFGTLFTAAAIAHVADLPSPVQARLASYLRVHIMQGLPMALSLSLTHHIFAFRTAIHRLWPAYPSPDIFA